MCFNFYNMNTERENYFSKTFNFFKKIEEPQVIGNPIDPFILKKAHIHHKKIIVLMVTLCVLLNAIGLGMVLKHKKTKKEPLVLIQRSDPLENDSIPVLMPSADSFSRQQDIQTLSSLDKKQIEKMKDFLNKQEELNYKALNIAFWEVKYIDKYKNDISTGNLDANKIKEQNEVLKIQTIHDTISNNFLQKRLLLSQVLENVKEDNPLFMDKTPEGLDPYEWAVLTFHFSEIGKAPLQKEVIDYQNYLLPYLYQKESVHNYLDNMAPYMQEMLEQDKRYNF